MVLTAEIFVHLLHFTVAGFGWRHGGCEWILLYSAEDRLYCTRPMCENNCENIKRWGREKKIENEKTKIHNGI